MKCAFKWRTKEDNMGIELKPCGKCGGEGRLTDGDHRYNPKNKTIKFLNSEDGFTTIAECKICKRHTWGFKIPFDAINEWNNGKIYSDQEWKDKLAKEYTGRIFSEEEIMDFILQTEWETYDVVIYFTNSDTTFMSFDSDEESLEYFVFDFDIYEKELGKAIHKILNYIKQHNLKVREMRYRRK